MRHLFAPGLLFLFFGFEAFSFQAVSFDLGSLFYGFKFDLLDLLVEFQDEFAAFADLRFALFDDGLLSWGLPDAEVAVFLA